MTIDNFKALVWQQGRELYRDMPWRTEPSPYFVLVSELMLQQTQVARVVPKFEAFIMRFSTIEQLSRSSLTDVLSLWNGLGYNRRAKYLWQTARMVSAEYNMALPRTFRELLSLPGVGTSTAAAIMNYAYQTPTPFVETNIRTVYFHHFFQNQIDITDAQLFEIVSQTIDEQHPREWFWALMDYGTYLKSKGYGRLSQSKHYQKQTSFVGSLREMRGKIIRVLTVEPLRSEALKQAVAADERFDTALENLEHEQMIEFRDQHWCLRSNSR